MRTYRIPFFAMTASACTLLLCLACGSTPTPATNTVGDSNTVGNSNTVTTTGDGTYANCATTNAPVTKAVTLQNFAFSPECIQVAKGDTVTFTNLDNSSHLVQNGAASTEMFASPDMPANATYTHAFTTAGTFPIICQYHGNMQLKVVVH